MGAYGGQISQGAVPHAAGASPGAPTISQQAFGTYSQNSNTGASTAGFGTVGLGIAGAVVLAWLWWSLPR
jgi:hypothetical protein